jgi:hypothetical protein
MSTIFVSLVVVVMDGCWLVSGSIDRLMMDECCLDYLIIYTGATNLATKCTFCFLLIFIEPFFSQHSNINRHRVMHVQSMSSANIGQVYSQGA